MTDFPATGLQIVSTLHAGGMLEIALAEMPVAAPGPDEVVIRVEATPINPSDLLTLIPTVDPAEARFEGSAERPRVLAQLSPEAAAARVRRVGEPLTAGLEGAGTVVAAGSEARHLQGVRVGALTLEKGLFAQYQTLPAAACVPLPPGVDARAGAALFCNPLTALAIVETVRIEGHRALVHTAAASNLGRMLVGICREDGIPLVNVVRRREQAELLAGLGATHVCDSSAPGFADDLSRAIEDTGATVAFDAIGGGAMGGTILKAMERAAAQRLPAYSAYGSFERKQLYLYGHLDEGPTLLTHADYGLLWGAAGWVMPDIMLRIGEERAATLRARALAGATGTFTSAFGREVSLAGALRRDAMIAYARHSTGAKYLINPAA